MNTAIQIRENLYYIGVNDRETALFENMWPLPKGVTYNSYLITGEKNILIDGAKSTKFDNYNSNIDKALGENGKIDYMIVNHMEPDHSSSIKLLLSKYPEMKVIGNKKTLGFIKDFYKLDIEPNFIEVTDGQTLQLGNKELTFYTTPMVHWPESMVTYDAETKTLFSQDAFGGFGTLNGGIFDDELNWDFHEFETRRYYTNIVGKYSDQVQRALKKLAPLEIKTICPVHGVVWRKNPEKIIELYDSLSSYKTQEGVVIAYGSMYGNTAAMAERLAGKLSKEGIRDVIVYDVSKTHISYILTDIWKYKGLILGSCSYNNGLYPVMEQAFSVIASNKLKNHVLGVFGTYAWSGGGVKTLKTLPEKSRGFDFIEETVEAKCSPSNEDYQKLDQLAMEMIERMRK